VSLRVTDFDFALPAELIAQAPLADRGSSRLLHLVRRTGAVAHRGFRDLPSLLQRGDLLVVNDTKVFPARLLGVRLPGGGAVECLLVRRVDGPPDAGVPPWAETWVALVHPGQRLREGSRMRFERDGVVVHGEILGRHFHGRRTVRVWAEDARPLREAVDAVGHVPLPPYIKRDDLGSDRERYQTVYARARGSIAAPTAGLHFTPDVLEALEARGVERTAVTLHVGYGTFQPIRVEQVEEHRMEAEQFEVSAQAAAAINLARRRGGRVIAVGTTSTRTLESLVVAEDGAIQPGAGDTSLFIHPGHAFRVVDGLVTNFHLPKSSLLMLVSALAGRDHVLAAYADAVREQYRFYSYGDAMAII
jgi:S-adenosylmethionine:tRNA ribosyltransferase-isomerase